ncbi:GNAT family N-acetyltransferase [Amycolatopsis aidingensis]|uniref:GNAT family N-acetyltransferase n=1 Tax=Amycolatopsis aidingensis TaxID=2842453 RepID=UPI001C0BCA1F|nr:GNAT family N-acetyltransferase [Amycolatopsis aidingensis]
MEIRAYTEADRAELRALFGRAGEGAPTASLWGHVESEAAIYLDPYLDREPESVLLAVVDGALAGYLVGCLDSSGFPSESARMEQAIKRYRLMLRPATMAFFARALTDMAWARLRREPTAGELTDQRWPAHLHINVEPMARGTGAAAGLMHRWFDRLRENGSPGCHLQTLRENTRAVRFFERMGFHTYGQDPLVPGLRHQGGRLHQRTMVWTP